MLLIAGRRLCNLIGVRFYRQQQNDLCCVFHHPSPPFGSPRRAGTGPARASPASAGGVYWAEQGSTKFSRCRAAARIDSAGRPPQCGNTNGCANAQFQKHDGSPPFHSSIWVNPLITMRSSYPEMLPPDTSARAHKICGQGRSLLHCGSICGCPPGSG